MHPALSTLKTLVTIYIHKIFEFVMALFSLSEHLMDADQLLPIAVVSHSPVRSLAAATRAPPHTKQQQPFPRRPEPEPSICIPPAPSLTFTAPRRAPRPPHRSPTRAKQRQHFGSPVFQHTVHPRSLMLPLTAVANVPASMVHKLLREIELSREKIWYAKKQREGTQAKGAGSRSGHKHKKTQKRHSIPDAEVPAVPRSPSSSTFAAVLHPETLKSDKENIHVINIVQFPVEVVWWKDAEKRVLGTEGSLFRRKPNIATRHSVSALRVPEIPAIPASRSSPALFAFEFPNKNDEDDLPVVDIIVESPAEVDSGEAVCWSDAVVETRHSWPSSVTLNVPASSSSPALLGTPNTEPQLVHCDNPDAEQLLTALMQEAQNTSSAIAAEQEDGFGSGGSGSLIASISASRSMTALANASSRSISELLNTFDKVMASPSWTRYALMADRLWIQSLRSPVRSPQSRTTRVGTRTQNEAPRRGSAGPATRVVPNIALPQKRASLPTPRPSLRKRTPAPATAPTPCKNICCKPTRLLPDFALSRAQSMARLRANAYEPDLNDEISRAEAQRAVYEREIPRLRKLVKAVKAGFKARSQAARRSAKLAATLPTASPSSCRKACCDAAFLGTAGGRELLRLGQLLVVLEQRRAEVEYYLSVRRTLAAPIRQLPVEVLILLFSFVVPPPHPVWVPTAETTNGAVRLSHVCACWRSLVLADSTMWTTLSIRNLSGNSYFYTPTLSLHRRITRAKHYLQRSRHQPLGVSAYHSSVEEPLLRVLMEESERWKFLALRLVGPTLALLDCVAGRVPLLASLTIMQSDSNRDASQLVSGFANAPLLRRVSITVSSAHVWPARTILPWTQLTSLTLSPISIITFTECIKNCAQLLYFEASVSFGLADPDLSLLPPPRLPDWPSDGHRRPLRTLVLRGSFCQDVLFLILLANPPRPLFVLPHLRVLSIDMNGLQPDLYAALARCCRLEMLALRAWSRAEMPDVLPFWLAVPTLRILHFRDHNTAMVSRRVFEVPATPQEPPPRPCGYDSDDEQEQDDNEDEVEPAWKSFAELNVEGFEAYDSKELYTLLCAKQAGSIDAVRLQFSTASESDLEDELAHWFYR
uniref:F-box domain-containing protein n=1 Tax=Mycena chlorophos TaxID=658473 RepID=A0ABQ0KWG2_MYCCL|nr:predicted protein [Mycena chlorophos]